MADDRACAFSGRCLVVHCLVVVHSPITGAEGVTATGARPALPAARSYFPVNPASTGNVMPVMFLPDSSTR